MWMVRDMRVSQGRCDVQDDWREDYRRKGLVTGEVRSGEKGELTKDSVYFVNELGLYLAENRE